MAAGADRCSYIRLNSITSDPLPHNRLLNVRVRSMVNGVFSAFGPACRLRINLTTQCPVTQLDTTAGPHYSCGRMDVPLDGSAYLWAIPVSGATKYKFRFSSGGYVRNVVSDGSGLLMNRWLTAPLLEGEVYSVRVRVSFDNGAHYCPFGPPCEVGIAQPHMVSRKASVEADGANTMVHVWPNPNRNGQVHIEVLEDDKGTHPATIEVRDLFGQAICHKELPVEGGNLGTVLDLDDRVASGLYVVSVTIGDHTHTERLILAR